MNKLTSDQGSLRTGYANRRRNSIHKITPRVIWKSKSRFIA
jgi:hypothetical protein